MRLMPAYNLIISLKPLNINKIKVQETRYSTFNVDKSCLFVESSQCHNLIQHGVITNDAIYFKRASFFISDFKF